MKNYLSFIQDMPQEKKKLFKHEETDEDHTRKNKNKIHSHNIYGHQ